MRYLLVILTAMLLFSCKAAEERNQGEKRSGCCRDEGPGGAGGRSR